MKKLPLFIIIGIFILLLGSCQKVSSERAQYLDAHYNCLENFTIPLYPESDFFVSGTLNEEDFRLSDGFDNYVAIYNKFRTVTTLDPAVNAGQSVSENRYGMELLLRSNTTFEDFDENPYFQLSLPKVLENRTAIEFLDSTFIKNENLAIRKDYEEPEGIEISIPKPCYEGNIYVDSDRISGSIYFTTSFGQQDESAFVKVVNYQKIERDDFYYVDIHLLFRCDLYYNDAGYGYKKYGTVENGEFKVRLEVPKQ